MADIHFFGCSLPVRSYIFLHDVTKNHLKRMLTEKEILQMLHNLSETDSSDEKSDLSQDAYVPCNEIESTSLDECFAEITRNDFSKKFQNEENSSINIDS
ncbi:hypothetical protein AVEN_183193-1 [Araneus ventricosus]|uniref:Uncharacterized protein n=1 Tax=Araneus ventricosus TaxID=182803 RepID=A0A4Y2J5C1_ARAVE|nr:hypothetical protein AVEN_183193-1 [Araneus ventricosus]